MLCGHLDLLWENIPGSWSSPLESSAAALPVLHADRDTVLCVAEAFLRQKEVNSLTIRRSKLSSYFDLEPGKRAKPRAVLFLAICVA